ncbi:hypothetical protein [Amycolatopsis sp. NPDC051371]|uniref:hypothetical protein n=1 Tax=Amycolatopsis sp. NPDC051371 TaxID=3155800 RepID=UPI003439BD5D
MNSGLRQPRTGVVDGGVGVGTSAREDGVGAVEATDADVVLGAVVEAGTEAAGAAAPPTGPSPQPATTKKGIVNTTASILRRIFPPAT